jgi:hypothetical protein
MTTAVDQATTALERAKRKLHPALTVYDDIGDALATLAKLATTEADQAQAIAAAVAAERQRLVNALRAYAKGEHHDRGELIAADLRTVPFVAMLAVADWIARQL